MREQNNPREPIGFRGLFHDKELSRTGEMLLFGRASSGVTEDTDIGVGSDDEVRLCGAALVITN